MAIPKYFVNPNHARKRARDRHGNDNLFAYRNAAILRRTGIRAGGSQFVTPLRAPEKNVNQTATDQRQNESDIYRNPRRQARNEFPERR